MFKKINNYLLTHYPLLWNTQAVWGTLLLLLLHGFYYWYGYTTFTPYKNFNRDENIVGIVSFAIIVSLLLLIVWLITYFRQNALKSIYPVSRWYLLGELLIVMTFSYAGISFMQSYFKGNEAAKMQLFKQEKIAEHINNYYLGASFIPINKQDFMMNERMSKALDLFKSEDELKAYLKKNPLIYYDAHSPFYKLVDSAEYVYSYLNYNFNEFSTYKDLPGIKKVDELRSTQHRWLLHHQKDSIANCIYAAIQSTNELNKIVEKLTDVQVADNYYAPKLDLTNKQTVDQIAKTVIDSCFATPNFTLPNQFIGYYTINNYSINQLVPRKNDFQNSYMLVLFMYLSFGLSILIIGFRWTNGRSWLIAFVGIFIWIILIVVATILHREPYEWSDINYLWMLFVAISAYLVYQQKAKTLAGVLINWSIWLFPFIYLINWPIQLFTRYESDFPDHREILNAYYTRHHIEPSSIAYSLNNLPHVAYFGIHILLIALFFAVIGIPFIKKYQAMKS